MQISEYKDTDWPKLKNLLTTISEANQGYWPPIESVAKYGGLKEWMDFNFPRRGFLVKNEESDHLIAYAELVSMEDLSPLWAQWWQDDLEDLRQWALIRRLGVHPKHLKKGISSDLANHLMQLAKKDARGMAIDVLQDNTPAKERFSQLGFEALPAKASPRSGLMLGRMKCSRVVREITLY